MRRAAVRELLEGFFDGSEAELLLFLRGSSALAASAPATVAAETDHRIDTVLL